MSSLHDDDHRKLQDRFDSRQPTVFTEVRGRNKRFIESRDMFFLATVDRSGRPTVSYKGGAPGFVKVVDDPLLGSYAEADLVVRVQVGEEFANCPRYIHPHRKLVQSRYVPMAGSETPFPSWKRTDDMQDIPPERDAGKTAAAGRFRVIDGDLA